jgi:hypothetical protein
LPFAFAFFKEVVSKLDFELEEQILFAIWLATSPTRN